MDKRFEQGRDFLKSNWHLVTETKSDQSRGMPMPPQEFPPEEDDSIVALPPVESAYAAITGAVPASPPSSLHYLLMNRKSRRVFSHTRLSMEQLSYLLWACEGVRENKGKFSYRTTPSGGARHPLDLYVFAHNVEGLKIGLYRYLPLEHSLVLEREGDDSVGLDDALNGQFRDSACVIMWAAVPYRSEWRYGKAADKLVALDAGHSCQNLYLACEALGLGTCAIGAYDQKKLDAYLGLDGEDMFALYAAPVGTPK
ncbi:MAG: SagB/ThcOx family dehydrogenase [Spirochaetaceae bacterium]|nr:SagB/ThcOx family dehydrogenase [Spirochaetaceae bacterium]